MTIELCVSDNFDYKPKVHKPLLVICENGPVTDSSKVDNNQEYHNVIIQIGYRAALKLVL